MPVGYNKWSDKRSYFSLIFLYKRSYKVLFIRISEVLWIITDPVDMLPNDDLGGGGGGKGPNLDYVIYEWPPNSIAIFLNNL